MNIKQETLDLIKNRYSELKNTITDNFPSIYPQMHACLAALGCLCFQDLPLPVTLILTGPSGSGKTEPLIWLLNTMNDIFVRSDGFTSASFVSHAANVKKQDLDKNDLLPKLNNRCLVTKELAPIFTGREEELSRNFAQLASVLDGEGLVTNSGTHGTRGYDREIKFIWLGATTPPKKRVFNLMANLGTRIFFYSISNERPQANDYADIFKGKSNHSEKKNICKQQIREYLECLHKEIPLNSILINDVNIPDKIADRLGLLCEALTLLRGEVSIAVDARDSEDRYDSPKIEHGWRAVHVLDALIRASAIIRGNDIVDEEDYDLIKQICFSSMYETRRKVFEVILNFDGFTNTNNICNRTGMAAKTALHYMKELEVLGVGQLNEKITPHSFTLNSKFKDLIPSHNHNSGKDLIPKPDVIDDDDDDWV